MKEPRRALREGTGVTEEAGVASGGKKAFSEVKGELVLEPGQERRPPMASPGPLVTIPVC